MIISLLILGILGMLGSGYAIYRLIDTIWDAAVSQNIWLLAAGGILAYLFLGLLISAFAISVVAFLVGLCED